MKSWPLYRSVVIGLLALLAIPATSCRRNTDAEKRKLRVDHQMETNQLVGAWESSFFPNYFLFFTQKGDSIHVQWNGFDVYSFSLSGNGQYSEKYKANGTGRYLMNYYNLNGDWEAVLLNDGLQFTCPMIFTFPIKYLSVYPNLTQKEAEQYLQIAEHLNFFTHPDSTDVARIDFDASTKLLGDFVVRFHDGRPDARYQVGKQGRISKLN